VFHGTDGDDWDAEGRESIPQLKIMMRYANRVGITIAQHSAGSSTEVEKYIKKSGLLEQAPELIRMDVLTDDADESRLIEGIRKLISQDKR
jgi:predicted NUDIX family NTP pyrophosphohydrolase